MRNKFASSCWIAAILLISKQVVAEEPVVEVGRVRFTVVTPTLIRIEEKTQAGRFVNDPTMFAVGRSAGFKDFKLERRPDQVRITTPILRLEYSGDGSQGVTPANLKITVTQNGREAVWTPGAKNPGNLGGTIRTLDNVFGPVSLGEGILSRDGWYLLDDSKSAVLTNGWVQGRETYVGGQDQIGKDWYFFGYGDDYRAALQSLAVIGGSVPMPRKNVLGTWYSRYWPYTADEFKAIVKEYESHNFPLDVIVMDMDWHVTSEQPGVGSGSKNNYWTGYTWDKKLIPDPAGLLKWFKDQGLAVTLNDHPAEGVQDHEEMYESFMKAMGADPSTGKAIPFDAGSQKYLETFWQYTHVPREKEGCDFWWLDWQQYPNTRSIPSLTNLAWLNTFYYEKSTANNQRGMSFSRWSGWGDHRHPIHFSGDAGTNWESLAFEVPMTATAANVGCFFWSHDIGGHQGRRNEESYARWVQFGAMSAALRSHSTRSADLDRRPWTYAKWAEDSMRDAFHLRSELFPYIYSTVWQGVQEMSGLTRPMYFQWPSEEKAYASAQQYMLGDAVLVAPIVSPGTGPGKVGRQAVWFPQGEWYNYFTGERIVSDSSGTERLIAADINEFPVYVKGGVPIPMQPYTPRMGTAPLKTLVLRCYPGPSGSFTLYEDDGKTVAYRNGQSATTKLTSSRSGNVTTLTVEPTAGTYAGQITERELILHLPGLGASTSVKVNGNAAKASYDSKTRQITVNAGTHPITQRVVVEVEAPLADFAQISRETVARLEAGAGGDDKAKLLANGIGIVASKGGPIGYSVPKGIRFYAPVGLLAGNQVKWEVDTRSGQANLSQGVAELPTLTSTDLPIAFYRDTRWSFEFSGKTHTLTERVKVDGVLDDSRNVARRAKVTASSAEEGYNAQPVVDGKAAGYPQAPRAEWASNHEKAGAWVRLTWDTPQTVESIALFDRPNLADHVTAAELHFSDGSVEKVGALQDEGTEPTLLRFTPKQVQWVEVRLVGVGDKTQNAGLSEIAVFAK